MKVLFYNHQGKISGAEKVILLILKRLDRSRFDSLMICPTDGTLAAETAKLGLPCQTVEKLEARFTVRPDKLFLYFISFIKTILQLRRKIAENKPDLIHANTLRAGLAAAISSLGMKIPVIWHLHDELPKHPLSTLIRLFTLCFKRIKLLPVSRATGKSFRGHLLQIFGKHLTEQVVHNGVELDEFKIDVNHRPKIRREFGLDENDVVLGIIGQITPRKGQLELIEAFAETAKELKNSTLLVVGSPIFNQDEIYLEKLKQAVKNLGLEAKVKFIGSRKDVPAVMQSLDFAVINSSSEALVLVALEAMACGTPVIATDVGGTTEIIKHKFNGWIIPFGNKKALIEALLVVGRDKELRRSFAAESRKIAVSELSAETFINQIEKFYEQCVRPAEAALGNDLAAQI